MAYTFGITGKESMTTGLRSGMINANNANGTARSGLNDVLAGGGQINSAIAEMNAQAENVIGQANAVNDMAGETRSIYDKLSPMADTIAGYGDSLWSQGQSLTTEAKDVFGQGKALVTMDPTASGLAGEFVKYWNSLSPDRLVSQATSDVQSAQQNAMAQAERNLSRRGVSATSGAFGALQRQYQQSLATALAAAKTKMRQTGRDQQAAQLDKMVGAANTLYGMGNQTEQNALAALTAGVNAQKGAADVVSAQGSGYAQVAELMSKAGTLFGTAADIYGSTGQLQNQYLSNLNTAYGHLASAQQAASDYYRQAIATEAAAVNGGGGTVVSIGADQNAAAAERAAKDAEFHNVYYRNLRSQD